MSPACASAMCIGPDETSTISHREFLLVVIKCDSTSSPPPADGRFNGKIMFAVQPMEWDEFSAAEMCKLLKTLDYIDWSRVLAFARDDGNVIKALGNMIIEWLQPCCLSVWCYNHLGQLFAREMICEHLEIDQFTIKMETQCRFFVNSPKAVSMLRSFLAQNRNGPRMMLKTVGLTRWTAIGPAANAVVKLLPYVQ